MTALPFALLMVAVMFGLYRVLHLDVLREKAEERRARRAIEEWIAREQEQQAQAAGVVTDSRSGAAGPQQR